MREFRNLLLLIFLIVCAGVTPLFAQDLVITKDGDIFECMIIEDQAESIKFSIPYINRTYTASMDKKEIAYSGSTSLLSPANRSANKKDSDIIFKKSGEVLKCNITSTASSELSFSFHMGANEISNSLPWEKVAYYKRSYLSAIDLRKESTKFVADNSDSDTEWSLDSTAFAMDLIVTKAGDVIEGSIEEEKEDSVFCSIPYMGEDIKVSFHKEDLAYAGSAEILKPAGDSKKSDDLIITKSGEILKCNITSTIDVSIAYSFLIGKNTIKNTIPRSQIAYFKKSYAAELDLKSESAIFIAKNYIEDEGDAITPETLWYTDSNNLDRDLLVTKSGEIIISKIVGEQGDSILFSLPFRSEEITISRPLDEIAYSGKVSVLKPSDPKAKKDDLIITKNGEILLCDIIVNTSSYVDYYFNVGGNRIRNSVPAEQIAYVRKSYVNSLDLDLESAKFAARQNSDQLERISNKVSYSKDLIVEESGNELLCKIEKIDQNKIYYSSFEGGKVKEASIAKFDVDYYVKNHADNLEANKVFTNDFEKDQGELIVTSAGDYFVGEILDLGLNSIEMRESGSEKSRYFKMADVVYYGRSFLNTIQEGNKLQHPTYSDLIYKSNNSVLLCKIDKVSSNSVRYSFTLGSRVMYNEIPKDEIVYYGVNIFDIPDSDFALAQVDAPKEEGNSEVKLGADPMIEQAQKEVKKEEALAKDDPSPNTNPATQEAPVKKTEVSDTKKPDPAPKEVIAEPVARTIIDETPPQLILFAPEIASNGNFKSVENETSSIRVSGILLDDAALSELMINGSKVSTTKDGKFEFDMSLAVGDNSISIEASDEHANALLESYSIVREQQIVQAPVQKKETDSEGPVLSISYPNISSDNEAIVVSNATKRIQVSGNADDPSGVFEVLVNNMDATLTASGEFSINIPLRVGENTLTVKASDLYFNDVVTTLVIKRQDVTTEYETPEIIEAGAKYYAILIGVSDYVDPYIPNLDENPINDAERLRDVLVENYYFDEENMFFMPDPDRSDILRTFDRLSKKITEKDNLLIFFAGHGYYDESTELGYWLPADAEAEYTANWIYNDVLVANLKRINSRHTLLISDACFSGSIFKTRAMPGTAGVAYAKKYDLSSRKAITSGVLESVPNQSIFFKYFIQYLEKNQEPLFSASELFRNIEIPIGNNSPNSPLYGVIQNVGDEGGDFIFIRR